MAGLSRGLFVNAGIKLLGIVIGGEFLIMLTFAALGWEGPASPWLATVLDPVLLALIVCWPIWHWVVLPLSRAAKTAGYELMLLSRALEQLDDGVIITDRAGRIEYINEALCRMMNISENDVLGRFIAELEPRMNGPDWRRSFLNCVVRQKRIWREELREPRWGDSKQIVVEHMVAPVRSDDGHITHFVTIKRDIAERREMERQLQHAQKMEVIGALSGGIAHNFNNMLAAITGNVYLLRELARDPGIPPDISDKMRERLSTMEQVAFQAADHVRSLLAFARKGEIEVQPTPLAPLVKETLKLARDGVPEDIELECKVEDMTASVDASQLQQSLLNLVNNAVDALEGAEEPRIRVSLTQERIEGKDYACLVVEDNGAGMPRHVMQRACDPYFTTKPVGKGTGLGLAMTKGFVEQCGGWMDIRSEPTKGCAVTLCLPLAEQDSQEQETAPARPVRLRPGTRVLLADDEPSAREALAEALRSMGCKVIEAFDGRHALERLANEGRIHAAVLDIVMPHMGGIQAARRMKEVCPDIPVLLLTGYDANGQAECAVREGVCEGILNKPAHPETIAEHLARLLPAES